MAYSILFEACYTAMDVYCDIYCYNYTAFEACYTAMDGPVWRFEIPLTGGLQTRVIVGGVIASTARAIIETPLEYAKVLAKVCFDF